MSRHDAEVTRTQMSGTTYHRTTALGLPVLAIVFGQTVAESFLSISWYHGGVLMASDQWEYL